MTNLSPFKATTKKGCQDSLSVDEITLHGTAELFRAIGIFFINAAYEMDLNEADHIHLQDNTKNFSSKNIAI